MHPIPQAVPTSPPGEVAPTLIEAGGLQARHQPTARDGRGCVLQGTAEASLLNRVGRVLADLSVGRMVTDADLLQHRNDCRQLMEAAAERWQDGRESRETVERWQACFLEAIRRLSPAFKAAREQEIQQSIAAGVGYFVEQGDAARARVAGRRS